MYLLYPLQAQAFVTALKASQKLSRYSSSSPLSPRSLPRVSEHVKNYRPKLLLLSGPPSSRPGLVDFANLITKKISLLSSTDIVRDTSMDWQQLDAVKTAGQDWYIQNKVTRLHRKCRLYSSPCR